MYVVIVCHQCGDILLAKIGQKTRQCPNCQARIVLKVAGKLGYAKSSQEALSLIRILKAKGAFTQRRF